MSAIDKLRSFAESRDADDLPLPAGALSYGDVRILVGLLPSVRCAGSGKSMSTPMTPEREAELRAKLRVLLLDWRERERHHLDDLHLAVEALDAMAFERDRADAAEAKLARVRELFRFQSSGTAHVVLAEIDKPASEDAPYYDPVTGRCPHGTRYPHECRDGCEER